MPEKNITRSTREIRSGTKKITVNRMLKSEIVQFTNLSIVYDDEPVVGQVSMDFNLDDAGIERLIHYLRPTTPDTIISDMKTMNTMQRHEVISKFCPRCFAEGGCPC